MKLAAVALAALIALAACADRPAPDPQAAAPAPDPAAVPTVLRVTVTGKTSAVLGDGTGGTLALLRKGADAPVAVAFRNGAPAETALPPGRYSVASIGTLECEGMGFEVAPGAAGRALGSLDAEILQTEYFVAIPKPPRAAPGDAAALAAARGVDPAAIDATPLAAAPSAICYVGRNYETAKWSDLPVSDRVVLTVLMAGFCAAAVAFGGFCAF